MATNPRTEGVSTRDSTLVLTATSEPERADPTEHLAPGIKRNASGIARALTGEFIGAEDHRGRLRDHTDEAVTAIHNTMRENIEQAMLTAIKADEDARRAEVTPR